jgi:cytochrome c oxidase subunit 1
LLTEYEEVGLNPPEPIHLPNPSYYPFMVGVGMPMVGYGLIYDNTAWGIPLLILGAVIIVGSFIGWGVEPLEEPHAEHHPDEPGNEHPGTDGEDS